MCCGVSGVALVFNQHLLCLTDSMVSLQGTGRENMFGVAWGQEPSTPDSNIFLVLF